MSKYIIFLTFGILNFKLNVIVENMGSENFTKETLAQSLAVWFFTKLNRCIEFPNILLTHMQKSNCTFMRLDVVPF